MDRAESQIKAWSLLTLFLLTLAGCSGKTVVESDLNIKGAPDWVNEGTQILKNKNGRLFHGVGSAPAMGSESLQLSTADNRARAEVARVLSSYMNVISNDYLSSAHNSDETISSGAISQQIEAVTKLNLAGAKIVGRWRDPKTNMVYSLAELDKEQINTIVSKTDAMNSSLKEFMQSQSDSIFDRQTGGK
ncbi:MAG TPA: hypothetical protein DCZ03_09990 [Gammaproteobacteria bacterium]|nr:hypothetical protein [Gammaproteobacteria bacterium]